MAEKEAVQRLRIRVVAYESKLLDNSVKQILDIATRHDATVVGPIPLPTTFKRWTVNRAPFVYKNAREQFEMRVHKRMLDIINPSPKLVEALQTVIFPSGVHFELNVEMLADSDAESVKTPKTTKATNKPRQNSTKEKPKVSAETANQ